LKRHRRRDELRLFDVNNPPASVVVSSQFSRDFGNDDFATSVRPRRLRSAPFK
jgi:hypothetical protein